MSGCLLRCFAPFAPAVVLAAGGAGAAGAAPLRVVAIESSSGSIAA
jgi:hypothetical protein